MGLHKYSEEKQGIETHFEQSQIDKEKVTKKGTEESYTISKCKCGLDNPAKFGKFNPNFDKYNIEL